MCPVRPRPSRVPRLQYCVYGFALDETSNTAGRFRGDDNTTRFTRIIPEANAVYYNERVQQLLPLPGSSQNTR